MTFLDQVVELQDQCKELLIAHAVQKRMDMEDMSYQDMLGMVLSCMRDHGWYEASDQEIAQLKEKYGKHSTEIGLRCIVDRSEFVGSKRHGYNIVHLLSMV